MAPSPSARRACSCRFLPVCLRLALTTIVEETAKGQTKRLLRKSLKDYHLPVYRAGGSN